VLITGPTGVGKTTTLNYMVDLINRDRRAKIVMIEDPVEFTHKPIKSLIVQQELHTDTHSFSRALIHVLRQNPDVIVIGEMRDLETIGTALTAAETGHLVLATLHTPNVLQTMERIIGVFPSDQQQQIILQLSNSLQGVIAQDLIPMADGSGRVLACEILLPTPAVRNALRENCVHKLDNILTTGRKDGMISMDASLAELYQRAVITYDAAVSRARDSSAIKRLSRIA
jgi:twitching motility protein PilT